MVRLFTLIWLALAIATPAPTAFAVQPDEVLNDPALEKRARDLSLELRCLVCQNQSIDDSNAPLARDLRLLVRDRLKQGDSDQEVIDFIVARYGEFVLLRPRFAPHNLILWLASPLLFLIGILVMYRAYRNRSRLADAQTGKPLTAKEEREVERLLK